MENIARDAFASDAAGWVASAGDPHDGCVAGSKNWPRPLLNSGGISNQRGTSEETQVLEEPSGEMIRSRHGRPRRKDQEARLRVGGRGGCAESIHFRRSARFLQKAAWTEHSDASAIWKFITWTAGLSAGWRRCWGCLALWEESAPDRDRRIGAPIPAGSFGAADHCDQAGNSTIWDRNCGIFGIEDGDPTLHCANLAWNRIRRSYQHAHISIMQEKHSCRATKCANVSETRYFVQRDEVKHAVNPRSAAPYQLFYASFPTDWGSGGSGICWIAILGVLSIGVGVFGAPAFRRWFSAAAARPWPFLRFTATRHHCPWIMARPVSIADAETKPRGYHA